MLSFITLAIAYYIEPSSISFLIALLIGCILECLSRGKLLFMIYEIIGILVFSNMFYEFIAPNSLLSFVGWGTLFSIVNIFLVIGISICASFLISWFGCFIEKKDNNRESNEYQNSVINENNSYREMYMDEGYTYSDIIKEEANNLILKFLQNPEYIDRFLIYSKYNYLELRAVEDLNLVIDNVSTCFARYLYTKGLVKSKEALNMPDIERCYLQAVFLISHYLVYEDEINTPSGIHLCINHTDPRAKLASQNKKIFEQAVLNIKDFALINKEEFLSIADNSNNESKKFFMENLVSYSNVYDYDEDYNKILFCLFLYLYRAGFSQEYISRNINNIDQGVWIFENVSDLFIVENIIEIMHKY